MRCVSADFIVGRSVSGCGKPGYKDANYPVIVATYEIIDNVRLLYKGFCDRFCEKGAGCSTNGKCRLSTQYRLQRRGAFYNVNSIIRKSHGHEKSSAIFGIVAQ